MTNPDDSIFNKLRELMAACGSNKNDSVIVMICACIDEGISGGSEIVKMLSRVGFKPGHVGAILHHNTGRSSERYHWYRDEVGAYYNHNTGS